jgi:putative peptide zinc metalloprotease protein
VTYVETRISVWEALAGRAPGTPLGPADAGIWNAVVERLNPARARPVLRAGVEAVELTSVRGSAYVMLRSPDGGGRACYLRLTPEEWQLALLMDGTQTVALLVAEFARIARRLAPDQVRRVVADLAGNRMLEELPVDAFRPLHELGRRALPRRLAGGLLAVARGRRMLVVDVDPLVTRLYRSGGRLLFTPAARVSMSVVAVAGLLLFAGTWWRGSESVFLTRGSYALGAAVLLLLNVLALASHELGHALGAKHSGREVPAAGVLVYFGIPSVFVDTTDVWMAGRGARLLATATGPATGFVLAGATQLVGLAVPALGPLAFKLAFAWYLNALFNLNPFLALDGYYLLMDWLEIPNLRARGLAWVSARLSGRPPAWSRLDREGRIVALYGLAAVLWLVIAVNLAYRVWADRVAGLVTGLWHGGAAARLLLVAVVLGLCAPLVYLAAAWLAHAWRRYRAVVAERRREADAPRRLAALRASDLGGLSDPALGGLAARARWLHPATGRQLVVAGTTQPAVYVVVDGALQARRPGDPGGSIRHRVGPGGVVGLVNALTGRPAGLDWHTAGTTLLALPTASVASVVGPLPGPPPADRAEAEALFAETPALAALASHERLALIAAAHPVDLDPGAPVVLPGPTHAVVVESGVIAMPDGLELRRGTLVGPVGDGDPGTVAQARTPVRLWVIPDAADLPPLLGGRSRGPVVPGVPAPRSGVHPAGAYPPLAVPPGPPSPDDDPEVDRRFERRMWWLVVLLLLVALLVTAANFLPGPAWAEMPAARALLVADRGRVTAVIDGRTAVLTARDRRYVDGGSTIAVSGRGSARLTFPGGAAAVLCGGSHTRVAGLRTDSGRHRGPHGTLALDAGRLLADTNSTSGAYRPLALVVARLGGAAANQGPAWYAVDAAGVTVATGTVTIGGAPVAPEGADLTCGDGVPVAPPAGSASASPSEEPSLPPPPTSESPASTPSTAPPATTTAPPPPAPTTTRPDPAPPPPTTTRPPTTRPPTTRPPTTRPSTTPPTTPTSTPPPTSPSPPPSDTSEPPIP